MLIAKSFKSIVKNPVPLFAAVFCLGGFFLGFSFSPWFFILMGIGVYGPDILREIHILNDEDEYQKRISERAGKQTFLISGILLIAFIIVQRIKPELAVDNSDSWLIFFSMTTITYFSSRNLQFWDGVRASRNILAIAGIFWLVFTVLSNHGDWISLLMQSLLVPVPFLLAFFLARRFPIVTGILLLLLAVGSIFFFKLLRILAGNWQSLFVFIVLTLPLILAGLALLKKTVETRKDE